MNEKLHSILTLALRSDTSENEALAAFHAARRMTAAGDLGTLLGEAPKPIERTVYQTAPAPKYEKIKKWIVHVKKDDEHKILSMIVIEAYKNGSIFEFICCNPIVNRPNGIEIQFKIKGTTAMVSYFDWFIVRKIDNMRAEAEKKKKGWLLNLFA